MTKNELLILNERYNYLVEIKDFYVGKYRQEKNKEEAKELQIIINQYYSMIELLDELKKAWRI